MRVKTAAFGIVTILTLAAMPRVSMAQGALTQFATAPSQPQFLPTQPPAIVTRVPFARGQAGISPIVIIQSQPVGPNLFFPPPNPVFVPSRPFLPDQFGFPAATFSPTQQIPPQMLDPVHILVPGQTAIP